MRSLTFTDATDTNSGYWAMSSATTTTAGTWEYTGDWHYEYRKPEEPEMYKHRCAHCGHLLFINLRNVKGVITALDCPKCGSPL